MYFMINYLLKNCPNECHISVLSWLAGDNVMLVMLMVILRTSSQYYDHESPSPRDQQRGVNHHKISWKISEETRLTKIPIKLFILSS